MTSGWQQPPKCSHMGLISAAFTIGGHSVGHVWKCACGKEFVVVLNDKGHKTLKPKE